MDFSRSVIIFNFFKVTRNFKFFMRRNLLFWKFPIWTPESRILFHSADLYEIFLNMHHLVTSMPKISFPIPFLVWKLKMFRPMPSKRKDARTGGHALWNQYIMCSVYSPLHERGFSHEQLYEKIIKIGSQIATLYRFIYIQQVHY